MAGTRPKVLYKTFTAPDSLEEKGPSTGVSCSKKRTAATRKTNGSLPEKTNCDVENGL
jgi:hypothetical protein